MTSLDELSKYLLIMELRFEANVYSNVGNGYFDDDIFDGPYQIFTRAAGSPPLHYGKWYDILVSL